MSKAHMVVLSFLKDKPFHGYQIGQLVEQLKLPSWTGITLPAIYKAMQNLEKTKHIRGEEMREGNNPPRMVYHLNQKGREYLRQIVCEYLNGNTPWDRDWWLALHFADQAITKKEMLSAIENRINKLKDVVKLKREHIRNIPEELKSRLPFVHSHLLALSMRYMRSELRTLEELKWDIQSGEHDAFFLPESGVVK